MATTETSAGADLHRAVQEYVSLGDHRTGTPVDDASSTDAARLAAVHGELRAASEVLLAHLRR